ncbi:MAG TPA: IPExxxVDY family protein [Chryseosolibacter sp.]|nr:IPExxxVDY family protein [Chryseosolibacter sp.]
MKKSKLVIDYEFDFQLWGVTTAARGYKLAWEINQHLGVRLVKQPDLVVGFRNNEEKSFSFYAYETPLNRLKLFKNRPSDHDTGKYFLIPEFPHYDFIILAAMEEHHMHELLQQVRSIPAVELVASIPLDGLKSKSNFIF